MTTAPDDVEQMFTTSYVVKTTKRYHFLNTVRITSTSCTWWNFIFTFRCTSTHSMQHNQPETCWQFNSCSYARFSKHKNTLITDRHSVLAYNQEVAGSNPAHSWHFKYAIDFNFIPSSQTHSTKTYRNVYDLVFDVTYKYKSTNFSIKKYIT